MWDIFMMNERKLNHNSRQCEAISPDISPIFSALYSRICHPDLPHTQAQLYGAPHPFPGSEAGKIDRFLPPFPTEPNPRIGRAKNARSALRPTGAQ
ncbi:MAG: hypothetical protein AAGN35_12770 [Bacteroidota bacterium]